MNRLAVSSFTMGRFLSTGVRIPENYGAEVNTASVEPQPAVTSRSRSRSGSSTIRPQRGLVAVHSAVYWHSASWEADGGGHCAGSWSALLRFERAVTATRLDS